MILVKSSKIRIYPNTQQRSLLRRWFGVSRKTYNATVDSLRTPETKANFFDIKKWLIPSLPEYTKEVPRSIRDGAVADACQAVTEAKRLSLQTGEFQQVKFRSKKAPIQTLFVRNDMIKDRTGGVLQASIFPTTLGKVRLAEPLPANPKDSRIIQENGRWFLCVPHEVVLPLTATTKPYSAVGIDPGVRTFLSFVGDGVAGQIGDRDFSKIARLCAHLDDLMSRLDPQRKDNRVSALKRHRMIKAVDKLRWKIKDLVREAYFKSARFLCDNFQILYLPVFESQRLASKAKRKLRKESVRAMLTGSHHRFRQRLLWMAKKSGVEVIDTNEAYTSKTVNWTGEVNHKLGGAKVVTGGDGQRMNRDLNGALGIYLKRLCRIRPGNGVSLCLHLVAFC